MYIGTGGSEFKNYTGGLLSIHAFQKHRTSLSNIEMNIFFFFFFFLTKTVINLLKIFHLYSIGHLNDLLPFDCLRMPCSGHSDWHVSSSYHDTIICTPVLVPSWVQVKHHFFCGPIYYRSAVQHMNLIS